MLSRELAINPKTVAKWWKCETVEEHNKGPKQPRTTVLSEAEEAMDVAFRRRSLDVCLHAPQPPVPRPTRSALHRYLQQDSISRLADSEGNKPKQQKFKRYPICFFQTEIAKVQTPKGKLHFFVGIDRSSSRKNIGEAQPFGKPTYRKNLLSLSQTLIS